MRTWEAKLSAISNASIYKADAENENRLLSGAKFELFADAGCTEHISGYGYPNGQPGADGVYYPDIPVPAAGSVQYYVKEVQAPENYLLAAGRVFVVTVDAEGKLGFSEKVLENGALRELNADEEAYIVSSTDIAITIVNEPNETGFEFNKQWLFNGEKQEWPKEVKSITVTLTRTCKAGSGDGAQEETAAGGTTQESAQGETAAGGTTQGSAQREITQSVTFTLTPQMKTAVDLKRITGSQISGTVSLVSTGENVYSYKITGLEDTAFGSTQGGSGPKWEYSISVLIMEAALSCGFRVRRRV